MNGTRVILAAHRGDKFKHPENTMPAFRAAVELGVDMIETDVRMTADGELVLMHDRSALRTAGVDQNIDELTLAQVRELDVGAPFSEEFKGVRIPTVQEFLEYIVPTGVLVNWELKIYPRDFGDETAFAVADRLIDMIDRYGMGERSMVNSFSARVLEHICKNHGHRFPIHGQGIYHCRKSGDTAEMPEHELFDWCCLYPNEKGLTALDCKENFDHCLAHGVIPCLCIADRADAYRKALDYGCKMCTSNNIYEGARILSELGARPM